MLGLILLSPLMLIIAFLILKQMGGPVIFRQKRAGLNGAPFEMLKFRTMKFATDEAGNDLPDAERITPLGKKLRATSMDELPELINVLRGEMSLVGPRPLLVDYLSLYSRRQARRHQVRPGVTGWAQVNGRNLLDWPTRLEMDVWYVDHQSLWLDLRILWKTAFKVLQRDGVNASGDSAMPRFRGEK